MKRISLIAFCILMLCSLLLIVNVGTTKAFEAGYEYGEYDKQTVPTYDGKWTTTDEWHDCPSFWFGDNACVLEGAIEIQTGTNQVNLVEFFTDNTNDTGDRWQICQDGAGDGGSAPNSNDYKFEIEGHTTLKVYQGTGTGWALIDTPAGITWADGLASTPHRAANHWILEWKMDKTIGPITNQPPHGLRVAVYDASNPAQGWQAWPPEAISKDNPDRWGQITGYIGGAFPEGITIGIMVLLSSVAVIVSLRYFRKRPKTTNLTPIKL